VRAGGHGQLPDDGDPVALSVHGMANTVPPSMRWLVHGFLTAINVGLVMQRGIQPSPTEAVELRASGEDFTRTVNGQARTELSVEQLFGVLRGEPATWRGVNQNGGQWGWDLTDVRLSRYAGIRDVQDYLARLEDIVGLSQVTPPIEPLGPMACPMPLITWTLPGD
jgi:hypothetical protein